MSERRMEPPQYDRIAHLYDVDMARNMPFDDVGFYARVCRERGGRILEIGCGNGRILLELIAAGLDATGIDGSHNMLLRLAAKADARRVTIRACRMDARKLAFNACFDVVLCPYSLVTYMAAADDAAALLDECRRVCTTNGVVVVDAFVPRPSVPSHDFTRDYARPYGDGMLSRSKRVTKLTPEINRIERRYEVTDAAGKLCEIVETVEDIRPISPEALSELVERSGLRIRQAWWNYTSTEPLADAQFFTIVAARA
jgi:ubiquinone/menaquinone biosynthesis C-methylase UbiE